MEPGFNCSELCNGSSSFDSQEQQQALQELCTVTVTSFDHSMKSSPSFSVGLLGVVWTFLTGGVLLALFFLIFTIRFRKNRIVKMSSPNLNIVTLLGSGLTYTSAYLFGIQEQSLPSGNSMEKLIQVRLCLLCVGTSLVFGPVLGKSWRLYKVFTQRVPDKRVIIKDLQLLVMVAALVLADTVLLLTWVFSDPVQCFRSLSVSLRATEKGMMCSMSRVQSCASLYSDLWLILILGFKSILLLCGTYLAGLTDNVSSSPVNQSLTLIVGVNLIFLTAGTICLVHRFFHTWHNLLFGFTSGGIFVCTTTINCFIFLPQLKQWKAFEEENQTMSHMAKYFTSPSRSYRSVYSEEQLYQLIGEKNSMKRLLTEKNAVIESLQEQVSSAKEKLMRLMSAESSCDPRALPAAPCTRSSEQPGHAALGDCCLLDPERDRRLPPCFLGTSPLGSNVQAFQKHATQESVCSQMLLFSTGDSVERGLKDVQECGTPAVQGQLPEQLPGQDNSGSVAWESSPQVNHVNSKKLWEILKELSLDGKNHGPALSVGPPLGNRGTSGEQGETQVGQEGYASIHIPLSPYLARHRWRIPFPPASTCFPGHVSPCASCRVKEVGSWSRGESAHNSLGSGGEMAGRGLLHPPAPSPPALPREASLQPEGWLGWPKSQGASLCIPQEQRQWQGTLKGPAEPSLCSLYYYPDSDSSSSSSEMFHGCQRPCCKVCFQSPRGSLDSSSTDMDTEPSDCEDHQAEHHGGPQPVVNFKDDLKPTFV
ncbi:probable G-protein coupled receptor 156 isoform X1 [Catharus ustulatus]|nr:probable G-protein coupled receptor 156 isoform X1 [Catharus ustulatus]XP_032907328.1 probable G-protein coupled receptor 156 isoform X1 [Catharus ustulatus]XP_032907329.1 probable G-protein coupled receptor 156 isoform X1 [Catharus ustulatus]